MTTQESSLDGRFASRARDLDALLKQLGAGDDYTKEAIHGGRSGAESFRVTGARGRWVVRVQPSDRVQDQFAQLSRIHALTGRAGLSPRVLHADLTRRILVVDYVEDVSLLGALQASDTGHATLQRLGQRLAQLHRLPLPSGLVVRPPLATAKRMLAETAARFPLPEVALRVLADYESRPTAPEEALCLCHLDLNPTNILFDGREVYFIDWETAGKGRPSVDLATLINWLLLDPPRQRVLLAAYAAAGGMPPNDPQLLHGRRLAYLSYGAAFLDLTRERQSEPDAVPTLPECYAEMGQGRLDMGTDAGRFRLALSLFHSYLAVADA